MVHPAPWNTRVARDRQDTATHAALLDAAERLFSERGYKRTSVAQIAEHAGVSRPTFYVYFSSREEIFRALAQRVHDEIKQVQREAGGNEASPEDVIARAIHAALRIYARKTRLLAVIAHQALTDDDVAVLWRQILNAPTEVDARFIRRLQRRHGARPAAPADLIAEVVTAALLRFAAIAADSPGSRTALARHLTRIYLRLVGWPDDAATDVRGQE